MKEELVSHKVAKLAKEKGFDIPTLYGYSQDGEIFFEDLYVFNYNDSPYSKEVVSAPTQALLQRWLRELYNIVIIILPYIDCESKDVNWSLQYVLSDDLHNNRYFEIDESDSKNTYEEALEKGLEGALNLI